MERLKIFAILILALMANSACYRYVETGPQGLSPGTDVRVRVSLDRSRDLEKYLDQDDTRTVSGKILEPGGPESLRLSVPFQGVTAGLASRGYNSLVDIPFLDLQQVEKRELNWHRTGGLIGISAVLAAVAVDGFFDPFDNGEGEAEPGDMDSAIITLLRIRW